MFGKVTADHLCILRARLLAAEPRIGIQQILTADQLGEFAPVFVGINDNSKMAVAGRIRPAVARHQPFIAHRAFRRHKDCAAHVIGQDELRHRLQHRYFDGLALAGFLTKIKRTENRVDDV